MVKLPHCNSKQPQRKSIAPELVMVNAKMSRSESTRIWKTRNYPQERPSRSGAKSKESDGGDASTAVRRRALRF